MFLWWHSLVYEFWHSSLGQRLCERGAHSPGVIWYNSDGLEPDMHCKRCGKDLG